MKVLKLCRKKKGKYHLFLQNCLINHEILAQFITQIKNKIADNLNKLKKSTSSNVSVEADKYL